MGRFPRDFLLALQSAIVERKRVGRSVLVGIDGPGCSGKTSLCDDLAELLGDQVACVNLDDFLVPLHQQTLTLTDHDDLRQVIPHLRWAEIEMLIVDSLSKGGPAAYRVYDWEHDVVGVARAVPRAEVVLIEGLYALHARLRGSYDFRVFVDGRHHDRMTRCETRMCEHGLSPERREYWLRLWRDLYVPREQTYLATQRPFEFADVFVLGAGISDTRTSCAFAHAR